MKINPLILFIICILLGSCSSELNEPDSPQPGGSNPPTDPTPEPNYIELPSYPQRTGDAEKGYEYLIYGDYMNTGIPYDAFILGNGEDQNNILNREGDNSIIPHDYNAITADNGARVVAMNCLQCHSSSINGEFKIGLGNANFDFTINRANQVQLASTAIALLYGTDSKEWEAFEPFKKNLEILGPATLTQTRGVNPADKTTFVLTAYRDKNTLEQLDQPAISIPDEVIPSDVPAWWLLKKKNALFFHGISRKDYARAMITMVLATIKNADKAEEVDEKFSDILAYIKTIEAPKYPFNINQSLANQGEGIFMNHCKGCHGTYGNNSTYPNKLIALSTIGTDPALSNFYTDNTPEATYFKDWFNNGWFGDGQNALEVIAEGGYIAPPLDGIWATAPYFHNGSVPTIKDVLNSNNRPKYWSRTFDDSDYDTEKVGWRYTIENAKVNNHTYDTTIEGYGNQGHTFGDQLTSEEREALIEYLKTL